MKTFLNILKRNLKDGRLTFLIYGLIIFLCAYFLVTIYPVYSKQKQLDELIASLPPIFRGFLGEELILFSTIEGFLTIEFFNTTWVIILCIYVCLSFSQLISCEIEKKTIESVLSFPVRRDVFVLAKFLSQFIYLSLLVIITFLGLNIGLLKIKQSFHLPLILKILFSGFVLYFAFSCISLFISCIFNEQRKTTMLSIALFLFMYFFNFICAILTNVKYLRFFSLFYYFDASKIIKHNEVSIFNILLLLGVGISFLILSIIYFNKKEILI